jgi:hypothetical protein
MIARLLRARPSVGSSQNEESRRVGVVDATCHSGATISTGGAVIAGASAIVGNNRTIAFDIERDITKNIGAQLDGGHSPKLTISAKGHRNVERTRRCAIWFQRYFRDCTECGDLALFNDIPEPALPVQSFGWIMTHSFPIFTYAITLYLSFKAERNRSFRQKSRVYLLTTKKSGRQSTRMVSSMASLN